MKRYTGPADLERMLALLVAVRSPERISDYPSMSDLHKLLSSPIIQRNTGLWEIGDGRLVAYAFVDTPNNLRFEIAPEARGLALEAEMIAWGESCLLRAAEPDGPPQTLDAVCREEDEGTRAFLKRHGFDEHLTRTMILARALEWEIRRPVLPPGFILRVVSGEGEVPALVDLHQAAHGTNNLTVEDRLSWMRVPDYKPDLDLVVTAPGGELAAYCFCQVSELENRRSGLQEGWTDPIATHPDYQRLGLATALLSHGLGLLKERGLRVARLATTSENVAMIHAAQQLDYQVETTKIWYTKAV